MGGHANYSTPTSNITGGKGVKCHREKKGDQGYREGDGVRDTSGTLERENKKSGSEYNQSEVLLFLLLIMYE